MLKSVWRDLRYAGRGLRRSPTLVLVASLSLGLGTGVNTTIFSLASGVLLDRPTARDTGHLLHVDIGESNQASYPNYRDLDDSDVFEGLTGYTTRDVNWRNGDETHRALAQIVTSNFFDVLGIHPFIGRAFGSTEARPELLPRLAVVSYGFWKRRLQGDPAVVGRSLVLNGEAFTIRGVLPSDHRSLFGFGVLPEIYLPATESLLPNLRDRRSHNFSLIG